MLDELLRLVRIDRTGLAITLALGLVLGCGFGWTLDRFGGPSAGAPAAAKATSTSAGLPELPDEGPAETGAPVGPGGQTEGDATPTPTPTAGAGEDQDARTKMARALKRAVAEAEALGGAAEAAVLMEGWSRPASAGSANRAMRMWSMSKPITAIAVLQAAAAKQQKPSDELLTAIEGAITRSENCPQRRVVLGLQVLSGGPDAARTAVTAVTDRAGARRVSVPKGTQGPDAACIEFLNTQKGIAEPLGDALLLGTTTWTVTDAARFAFALGRGEYDEPGERVLRLMRQPKKRSTELTSDDQYTAETNWGAGKVFAGLKPAYKGGWGGTRQQKFMAGQYVILQTPAGLVAIAAMFHPDTQPPDDDPGKTQIPKAIESILSAVKAELGLKG